MGFPGPNPGEKYYFLSSGDAIRQVDLLYVPKIFWRETSRRDFPGVLRVGHFPREINFSFGKFRDGIREVNFNREVHCRWCLRSSTPLKIAKLHLILSIRSTIIQLLIEGYNKKISMNGNFSLASSINSLSTRAPGIRAFLFWTCTQQFCSKHKS